MRKILTLHIPITEYDTLGSESDNELQARAINQAKYRQRGEFPKNFCRRKNNSTLFFIQTHKKRPLLRQKIHHQVYLESTKHHINHVSHRNHHKIYQNDM